jgi:hypothetical protein
MQFGNVEYTLVSATISGGLEGTTVDYAPLTPLVPVWVGTNDIVVTYTYLPAGGGVGCGTPPCPPGGTAYIDEASDSGPPLLDDVFVEVYAPQTAGQPDPMLTRKGNYYGTVDTTSTTNQTFKIEADVNPTNPATGAATGSVFDRWVSATQGASFAPGDRDVNLTANQSGYFLAYYATACPMGYHFVSGSALSECLPDGCSANQNWDTATNTCVTCGTDQSWNPASNQCVAVSNGACPPECIYGCVISVVPVRTDPSQPGNSQVITGAACKNSAGGVGWFYTPSPFPYRAPNP